MYYNKDREITWLEEEPNRNPISGIHYFKKQFVPPYIVMIISMFLVIRQLVSLYSLTVGVFQHTPKCFI
jgi:hypothetical protein